MTYGDGVADVPIDEVLAFHDAHGKLATVTAVRPPSRFGALALEGDRVTDFLEKPQAEAGWINGGFFVFERRVLDYLADDDTILEREPLEQLAHDGRADGLSARQVLGADGHRARPDQPREPVGERRGPMEGVG